jgi:hypothetical protein
VAERAPGDIGRNIGGMGMSKGIDSVLRASVRVAFAVTIYLGAARDLSAQITQDTYVETGVVDSYNNLGKGPIRLRGGTLKVLGGN